MSFGEKMKAARISQNITLAELAASCDCTTGYLRLVESGQRPAPSPRIALAISGALQVDLGVRVASDARDAVADAAADVCATPLRVDVAIERIAARAHCDHATALSALAQCVAQGRVVCDHGLYRSTSAEVRRGKR